MTLIYWTCDGCGQTLQGAIDKDGDFISDKELDSGKPEHLRAIGCYLCGCPGGTPGPEVEDALEDAEA